MPVPLVMLMKVTHSESLIWHLQLNNPPSSGIPGPTPGSEVACHSMPRIEEDDVMPPYCQPDDNDDIDGRCLIIIIRSGSIIFIQGSFQR
jgi:hypothetical protein